MARDRSFDVAVTGMAVLVPGASSVAHWWKDLLAGRVVYGAVPGEDALAENSGHGESRRVPVHGVLPSAEVFDPDHFGMSTRAAALTDPQVRKLLEVSWWALEDAGQAPIGPGPVTAVFASISGTPYLRRILMGGVVDDATLEHVVHGCESDFVASTVAYRLGLTGPALAVQTACSSGLVATHLAIQSLLNGDCDQALVIAAGIDSPQSGYRYVPGGIWSPTGRCRPFSAEADGVVAGSGAVGVVLRRFADAEDSDLDVHGVLIGSAVNNDGAAKAGYFAPSPAGQEAVIRAAFAAAGTDASSIGFLESHGTGTAVGDPIEWAAASAALNALGAAPGQVAVGALKANIGHLDSAAGLASLVKALLVVREGVIPPLAGFDKPNPLLALAGAPLAIPTAARPWNGSESRSAAVSSFGIGGTNAHVVLEQAPSRPRRASSKPRPRLVVLSARNGRALAAIETGLVDALSYETAPSLGDVATTLAEGRTRSGTRSAVVAIDTGQLVERLQSGQGVVRGTAGRRPTDLILFFPGQGGQQPGMARPLIRALPGFADALDTCLAGFGNSLATEVHRALLDPGFPADRLSATVVAQPALFALGVSAATALESVGVRPRAVIGHSLGELTAATVAGVIPLSDACRVAEVRGQAMQECAPGAMATLWCDERRAGELIAPYEHTIEVAAVNGPTVTVVSGAAADVDALLAALPPSVPSRRLPGDRAFHSSMIEPARGALANAVSLARLAPAKVMLGLTGFARLVGVGESVTADELVDQARRPVRFGGTLAALVGLLPGSVGLEVGPGRALSALASSHLPVVESLLRDGAKTQDCDVLGSLGALWVHGVAADLTRLGADGQRVHLPTYPFAGRRIVAREAEGTVATHDRGPWHRTTVTEAEGTMPIVDVANSKTTVTALWCELLGVSEVSDEADFLDLGGDSLLVAELGSRITRHLGVTVPLRDLMVARTLGGQVDVVQRCLTAAPENRGLE